MYSNPVAMSEATCAREIQVLRGVYEGLCGLRKHEESEDEDGVKE